MKRQTASHTLWLSSLLLLLCGLVSPVQGTVGPKLKLEEKTVRYGEVWQGETIEHAFTVKNEGDAPLRIKRVVPD